MKLVQIIAIIIIVILQSCSFSKGIRDGEVAFERKQYAVAIGLLGEELHQTNSPVLKGRKAYLLGISYLKIQNYSESAKWLDEAVKHDYGTEAILSLAQVSKILENYEAAISNYEKLKSLTGRKQEIDREILICRQAMLSRQVPSEYMTERIIGNSVVSDYSPTLYEDDFLIFTSERSDATGKEIYNWTGQKFSDIYITLKSGAEVRKFDSGINSEHNDGTPWFTKDMNFMYFTRCFSLNNTDSRCKIMLSTKTNDVWNEPVVLPFVKDIANYSQPTLIENDSILVFASDLEQPGGTTDLYYSELLDDATWSNPEKLPATINTQGNEKFPTGDGDTLYFSSDYLQGFGGYDIFKTYIRDDYSWAPPINVGYGINSGGDEFSYIVDYKAKPKAGVTQQGYFTSSKNGSGKDDIYRFYKIIPQPKMPSEVVVQPEDTKDSPKSIFLIVKVYTPQYAVPEDPNSQITTKNPLDAAFVRILDEADHIVAEGYTNEKGSYFIAIPNDKNLKIKVMKREYLSNATQATSKNLIWEKGENTKTINTELTLDKIFINKEINLSNIYYDYDKWDIKQEAIPTLNYLATMLKENPRLKIQLSSHTDCRGEDSYNLILSQKRAQSVVDYLISEKIDPSRLVPIGYGESALLDTCSCDICTETQHQLNRRTTFKIIN